MQWVPENNHKILQTKIFFKPTDTHSLLYKANYHPKHTFKRIIKSQLIRFNRICSLETHFHEATQILLVIKNSRNFLCYVNALALQSIQNGSCVEKQTPKMSYLLLSPTIQTIVLKITSKCHFSKTQCTHSPLRDYLLITAYRRNKNLKDILVHSSLGTSHATASPDCKQF